MGPVIFIGDEVSAAGYRLGGADARVPPDGEDDVVFSQALLEGALVLITAQSAARLPEGKLHSALSRSAPPVCVVPDVRGRMAPPDLGGALKAQLGLAE